MIIIVCPRSQGEVHGKKTIRQVACNRSDHHRLCEQVPQHQGQISPCSHSER